MISLLSTKERAGRVEFSGVVEGVRNSLAKFVDFVLTRAGIDVGLADSNDRNEIMKHMIVVAACGRRIGYVEDITGEYIKLECTEGPSLIPLHWVDRVDSIIILQRDFEEVNRIRSFV